MDDLCARHDLGPGQARQLRALLALLAADPTAPTTLRDPHRALDDHLADSLVALDLESVRQARAIADLGSGAGFPGLPLAIALPDAEVFLVESNGRKCEFLAGAISACHVGNARVVNDRAETWAAGLGRCDLVVARALAPLAVIAEYAAPLLQQGGVLVAWRGRRDPDDERAGPAAAKVLGLQYSDPIFVQPYPGALHRHLQVLLKVAKTPDRFPRRPGAARKRPLGGS
ncbi:MAG: 16S rRNA (guanine(527)-N(7))-methyltransferase RsmG [Solirubrobacteraceae bacterium]